MKACNRTFVLLLRLEHKLQVVWSNNAGHCERSEGTAVSRTLVAVLAHGDLAATQLQDAECVG
jgi:hypothetical protein